MLDAESREKFDAYVKKVTDRLRELGRDDLIPLFENCYPNTLDTTFKEVDGSSFVITGDIHAMWLRDSAAQVHHYLPAAREIPALADKIESMIRRYSLYVPKDPYANAFNETDNDRGHRDDVTFRSPWVWERKYEVDSLCSVIHIAYCFYKETGRTSHLDGDFLRVLYIITDVFEKEQHHAEKSDYSFIRHNVPPLDTVPCQGKGNPVGYTGMTWSGFRPSDDGCVYGYLIPAEMYAVVSMRHLALLARDVYRDETLARRAEKLAAEIDAGIQTYGVAEHPVYGRIYAYEVDGLGHALFMDDANVPSLLSAPYIGYCSPEDEIYRNTRRFILSRDNPTYYAGRFLRGVGSPHTGDNRVWPISLAIQGLTTDDNAEMEELLNELAASHAGTNLMHEGINPDNPADYSRSWFAWANSIFSELVLKYAGFPY